MIRRHSLSAVCMHWFNAFCWIALLFTGFALLSNPAMQPVGMWWADLWTGVFGAYGLLVFHLLIGSAWLAVYFFYIVFGLRHDVIPFLKEVFSLSPASDMIWCIRKGMRLVLGEKAPCAAWGLTPPCRRKASTTPGRSSPPWPPCCAAWGLRSPGCSSPR